MAGNPQRRGLGKGLGALIVNTEQGIPAPPATVTSAPPADGVRQLPVELISRNPQQPRAHFDEAALAELAESIRAHGILQPLIVTRNPERDGAFWLVAGERRWRAARMAGLTQVPAIVREASPRQLMEWALVENVQRADLNPIEEATAYRTLIEEFGLTQADVATRVGKSRPAIANAVRLLQLPPNAQQAVIDNRVSAGHARALLALADRSAISAALDKVIARDLNVRQTEALVKQMMETAEPADHNPPAPQADAQVKSLESRFRTALGTRVNLNRNPDGTGRLVIHFFSDEDLDSLYRQIAGDVDDLP